jgi:hypothetical protein
MRLGRLSMAVAVAALSVGALVSGCGGNDQTGTALSIRITTGVNYRPVGDRRIEPFTLHCDPTGGDMPNRVELCRLIAKHPQAMLFPFHSISACDIPASVKVSGVSHGRVVRFDRSICEWPGSTGSFAYYAATFSPHDLAIAAVRLRCDEDPSLLRKPTPWTRVHACMTARPRGSVSTK